MCQAQTTGRQRPYRGGKGMLYEGGTRVTALANWPGHIKPGRLTGRACCRHVPRWQGLAGADTSAGKPLDGVDWPAISQASRRPDRRSCTTSNRSARPFVRVTGSWYGARRCPPALELYNIAQDPEESTDLSATRTDKVIALRAVAEQLAGESEKALFLGRNPGGCDGHGEGHAACTAKRRGLLQSGRLKTASGRTETKKPPRWAASFIMRRSSQGRPRAVLKFPV